MIEIEAADRRQIYTWYLLLPFPKWIKDKKTKKLFLEPPDGYKILTRIEQRYQEFGYDIDLAYGVVGHAPT